MSNQKGILQHSTDQQQGGTAVPKQKLKWDESKLQATEKQQKEQVFMKIDEPNTPYIHYNPTTDQVTNWKDVPESLRKSAMEEPEEFTLDDDHKSDSHNTKSTTLPSVKQENDEWNEEEQLLTEAEKRHIEFERKRAEHYKFNK